MITMLLGGLWHGAAWTFVAWGFIHALALAAQRLISPLARRLERHLPALMPGLSRLATLAVVVHAWVLFRATSFEAARAMLRQMYWPAPGLEWHFPFALLALAAAVAVHAVRLTPWRRLLDLPRDRWATPAVLLTMIWIVVIFHPENHNPFVYFQF